MGRPTKLTKEVQKRIVTAIKQGSTYELAAQYGGITYETFNEWMKQGRQDTEGIYSDFSEAIKSAEGEAVLVWLRNLQRAAADGNWQAAAWKLERRYPKDYGRQVHEHTVDLPPDSNFEKALKTGYDPQGGLEEPGDSDPDTP